MQGHFDGAGGRFNVNQAFDIAVARTGNVVKAQYFFHANGQAVGSFGRLIGEGGELKANFDVNYTPISPSYPRSIPGQLTVQTGDTLRSIAARIYGDASLWYVIAEENGLTDPQALLKPGTQLRIPNDVIALSNDATIFKPFDASDAIGDTTPTQPIPPPPKKKGCGVVGQILVIAVGIIVTTYLGPIIGNTAGSLFSGAAGGATAVGSALSYGAGYAIGYGVGAAVGSAVSQGVAIAIDQQESFSWKGVGASALSAGLLQGTDLGNLFDPSWYQVAAQSVVNNAVTQGVSIALGCRRVSAGAMWRSRQ